MIIKDTESVDIQVTGPIRRTAAMLASHGLVVVVPRFTTS